MTKLFFIKLYIFLYSHQHHSLTITASYLFSSSPVGSSRKKRKGQIYEMSERQTQKTSYSGHAYMKPWP